MLVEGTRPALAQAAALKWTVHSMFDIVSRFRAEMKGDVSP